MEERSVFNRQDQERNTEVLMQLEGENEALFFNSRLIFPAKQTEEMNIEDIEKFLDTKTSIDNNYVKINFKKRDAIYGLFVRDKDYGHLKSKNFWRIVTRTHFDEYNKSKNLNLAKIFSGSEFSRLSLLKEGFES